MIPLHNNRWNVGTLWKLIKNRKCSAKTDFPFQTPSNHLKTFWFSEGFKGY